MAKGTVLGVAILGLVIASTAGPVGVSAQQRNDRPRRSANSADAGTQVAFDEGYRKGFDKGAEDAQGNRSRPLEDFKEYRNADNGYRSGFSKGYQDAVNRQQYGAAPGQSPVLVPGRDRSGKPVLGRGAVRGRGPADAGPPGQTKRYDPNGGPVVLGRGGRNANRGSGYPGGYGYPGGVPGGYPGGYPGNQGGYAGAYPGGGNGGYGGYGGYGGDRRIGFSEMMVVELETPISTKFSREGERFSARVVDPGQYAGSRVEGYIGRIDKAGRVAGKAEVVLVFEGIIFPDGYAERMPAQVEEVLGYGYGYGGYGGYGGRNGGNKRDDINAKAGDEGQIVGEGSKGRDVAIIGGSTGIGAAAGAVLGGTKGAVIGAAIGAVTGGTVVATNRGRDIEMQPGAQLRIRTGQGVRP